MNRSVQLAICMMSFALLTAPASGDDPPRKLTAEERKELEAKYKELNVAGVKAAEEIQTVYLDRAAGPIRTSIF